MGSVHMLPPSRPQPADPQPTPSHPHAAAAAAASQAVEDMCRHGMADRLYRRLCDALDAHISCQLAALAAQTSLAPGTFLEAVAAMWAAHCKEIMLIRSIFLYLDRTHVIALPGLRSLVDTALVLLRQHLAARPEVCVCMCHPALLPPAPPCPDTWSVCHAPVLTTATTAAAAAAPTTCLIRRGCSSFC